MYGASKLAGEQAIAATGVNHLVLRTSWVYGTRGKNFLLTMLRLGADRPELSVVADQFGAPTWCNTIATLSAHLAAQAFAAEDSAKWWQRALGRLSPVRRRRDFVARLRVGDLRTRGLAESAEHAADSRRRLSDAG